MKLDLLGKVGCRGGADPGAALVSPGYVAVVMRWRETTTVACLHLSPFRRSIKPLWQREFRGDVHHQWAGQRTAINVPTVLPAGNGNLYAVGGTERLLLDGETGKLLAQAEACASPSAPATFSEGELLVPEGQAVAAYDATSLQPLWRKQTPPQTWAFAPCADGVIPVQEESSGSGALWRLDDGKVWSLRDAEYPCAAPVVHGSLAIVPSGSGVPERLTAVDLETGAEQWHIDSPRAEPLQPPAQGPIPVPNPAMAWGDRVLAITANSNLDARDLSDGRLLWQVTLTSEPTVLLLQENRAWVGAQDGSILLVAAATGALLDQITLQGMSAFAGSIIPLPTDEHAAATALAISHFGNIHLLARE